MSEINLPVEITTAAMAHMNRDHQKNPLTDGIQRVATAHVPTPKASRYLKALCNHFDRKAIASYDDHNGRIQFVWVDTVPAA